MRAVLYDVEWQLLRVSCLHDMRSDGGWGTSEGQEKNLAMLLNYLKDAKDDSRELQLRVYRVNNCLNAVVMGYNGQGKLYLITKVQVFRIQYADSSFYRNAVVEDAAAYWDWTKVEKDLLKIPNGKMYAFLSRDLRKRAQRGSERTRPELHKFLKCMDKVWPEWVAARTGR